MLILVLWLLFGFAFTNKDKGENENTVNRSYKALSLDYKELRDYLANKVFAKSGPLTPYTYTHSPSPYTSLFLHTQTPLTPRVSFLWSQKHYLQKKF